MSITPLIQRQPIEEEEEEVLQTKESLGHSPTVTPDMETQINAMSGHGQPLSRSIRDFFEPRFSYDFSQVRVHTSRQAADISRSMNAKAFTKGRDIAFGLGQYSLGTDAGKTLMAHELAHVVQNKVTGSKNTIYRVCRPARRRQNRKPDEGQPPNFAQLVANPCRWILYGFHIGSSEFAREFTPVVNQLSEYLRSNSKATLEIIGLTDCFGSAAQNAKIRKRRALSVKHAFPSSQQPRIKVLATTAYLVANDTAVRRAMNRSVQVELIPPPGKSCPAQLTLGTQLKPALQFGCSRANRPALETAAKLAVPTVITALARVRDWRTKPGTARLIDQYYRTSTNREREAAARRIIALLESMIPHLQKPILDCLEPVHRAYKYVCPNGTIADAAGAAGIVIPTFCMPQFIHLGPIGQIATVIHELSHHSSAGSTVDFGAYYSANTCTATSDTNRLTHAQRLKHADSFACFVTVLANR